jgi:glutamate--cysteine ligase
MPKVGGMGLDMMFRTCTVQANLDFGSEADMTAKFRTSLALQPIATALFANSPFVEGRPTGLLSSRANVWTDTDNDRTGMLGFVFADGFGFETYARYALDVPMYFVKRGDEYIDVAGRSFRDFMAGGLPESGDARASIKDWADHGTTIFPEVRLKKYLEMRGADVGNFEQIVGLSALWTGIFYDSAALAAAWDLCKDWAIEDHERLRADVTRLGLKAQIGGRSVRDVAKDMVEIAAAGLKARARLSATGADETVHLESLRAIADSGLTGADRALALYHGAWNGDVSRAYKDFAY